jgi:hypothetical protein
LGHDLPRQCPLGGLLGSERAVLIDGDLERQATLPDLQADLIEDSEKVWRICPWGVMVHASCLFSTRPIFKAADKEAGASLKRPILYVPDQPHNPLILLEI